MESDGWRHCLRWRLGLGATVTLPGVHDLRISARYQHVQLAHSRDVTRSLYHLHASLDPPARLKASAMPVLRRDPDAPSRSVGFPNHVHRLSDIVLRSVLVNGLFASTVRPIIVNVHHPTWHDERIQRLDCVSRGSVQVTVQPQVGDPS
eukprot:scaffold132586_cov66-Phaeocystis_antarctica.AAC.2